MPKARKLTRHKPGYFQEMVGRCLLAIATDIELLKANNCGEITYHALKKSVNEMKGMLPWWTVNTFAQVLPIQD
jgi:hypothetical protein